MYIESIPHFDADGDNTAQSVKTTSGRIHYLEVSNPNTSDAYIQFFDKATSGVTVGTTTPIQSFLVPAATGSNAGATEKTFAFPWKFNTAITYACTTTAAGNTDPSTGLVVNILYS